MSADVPFLFSIDVEDPQLAGGGAADPSVAAMTDAWLAFLRTREAKATFFVVGAVARNDPTLVRRIVEEGHEIACHSDAHVPIDRLGPVGFRDDLRRNRDALAAAGAENPAGYRAPCFSLTREASWAWAMLAEEGFAWSSSVLPARSPLCGWPGFGRAPRLIDGIVEMPMTLLPWRWLPVPAAGGVYFRVLPAPLLRAGVERLRRQREPVLGYFHPYDLDEAPAPFAFPGFRRGSLYDRLLRANRRATLHRLDALLRSGFAIERYGGHAARLRAALACTREPF